MRTCIVIGCGGKHRWFGYCSTHYMRLKKHGNVGEDIAVKSKGMAAEWILDHILYESDDCLVFPFARRPDGSATVFIDGKNVGVHVVIATINLPPKPSTQHEVRHICGNGHLGCVNPKHLAWGTKKENQADRIIHGTDGRGEKNVKAKLTHKSISNIRRLSKEGKSAKSIAALHGVTDGTIYDIMNGRSWGWMQDVC